MSNQTTTATTIPAARIDLAAAAPKPFAAMRRLEGSIELDATIRHLVQVRASQVNGCAFCVDMHWREARGAGETEERLYMLFAWPESALFDDRERAALALTEAVTLLGPDRVPDEIWDPAAARFEEAELANLLVQIAAINSWNRLMIASRTEPGHYEVGQH
jgi:AhpD family alkylhydroperoxidase